jgi:hypothetical protein
VKLGGQAAQVIIAQFQFNDQHLNPLGWNSEEPTPAHPMGYFVCLDRWGAPSEAERQNRMPFHGEASHAMWNVEAPPNVADCVIHAEMSRLVGKHHVTSGSNSRTVGKSLVMSTEHRCSALIVDDQADNRKSLCGYCPTGLATYTDATGIDAEP